MLTLICQYLRNWFVREKIEDKFTIAGGEISALNLRLSDYLQDGQYYRIIGSVFNDGVHQYRIDGLTDEQEFYGTVWTMAVPKEVIAIDGEIEQWVRDNSSAINSPYQSESFGGYSYSKGYAGGNGIFAVTWQSQFGTRLSQWRKI